jgi:hypothetical protein
MLRTILQIPMMDCPSEERVIRIATAGVVIAQLDFDLGSRTLIPSMCEHGIARSITRSSRPLRHPPGAPRR